MANKQLAFDPLDAMPLAEIDPVGITSLFSIFSTAVKVITTVVEAGKYAPENQELQSKFREMRSELLNLQNSLDDFVLLIERYVHESNDPAIVEKKLTISNTLMGLRERNYQRWKSIQDSLQAIDQRIYTLIQEIRKVVVNMMFDQGPDVDFDRELLQDFDSIILQMGEMTFGTFIRRLRTLLDSLSRQLAQLAHVRRGSRA